MLGDNGACRQTCDFRAHYHRHSLPISVVILLLLVGCAAVPEKFYAYRGNITEDEPMGPALTVGVSPLAVFGGTGFKGTYEVDDPGIWDISCSYFLEDIGNFFTLSYIPLTEETSARKTHAVQFSDGFIWAKPLADWKVFTRCAAGFRFTFLGPDTFGDDGFGFGWFARGGLVFHIAGNVGIELRADADGWVGGWDHRLQLAGSASLGCSLAMTF